MNDKISRFDGEYRWLSNFAPVSIYINNFNYPSVEHAYMSCKSDSVLWKIYCSSSANPPSYVKRESFKQKLVDDWDNIKSDVMLNCLRKKFSDPHYSELLLSTGDVELEEGNWWGDDFWGICLKKGTGRNVLGKLIMRVRDELRDNKINI